MENSGKSSIIVSFKTIYENTYTVLVMDLETDRIQFKHNNYQLWESPVLGFLSTYFNDFIILNKDGMSFIRLGDKESRRSIPSQDGTMRMVHSLNSANYLKIEDSNMINFENSMLGDVKTVIIQEQHLDKSGNTYYDEIFRINLELMGLRELILVQSLFFLETSGEIMELIELQPNNSLFFKSFMELD